jgi:hypothetical protein
MAVYNNDKQLNLALCAWGFPEDSSRPIFFNKQYTFTCINSHAINQRTCRTPAEPAAGTPLPHILTNQRVP